MSSLADIFKASWKQARPQAHGAHIMVLYTGTHFEVRGEDYERIKPHLPWGKKPALYGGDGVMYDGYPVCAITHTEISDVLRKASTKHSVALVVWGDIPARPYHICTLRDTGAAPVSKPMTMEDVI